MVPHCSLCMNGNHPTSKCAQVKAVKVFHKPVVVALAIGGNEMISIATSLLEMQLELVINPVGKWLSSTDGTKALATQQIAMPVMYGMTFKIANCLYATQNKANWFTYTVKHKDGIEQSYTAGTGYVEPYQVSSTSVYIVASTSSTKTWLVPRIKE